MLSGTHDTILNLWLFKSDTFAELLLVIIWPNDTLNLKMDDSY